MALAMAVADPEKLLWITIVLTSFIGTTRSLPEIIKIGKVSNPLYLSRITRALLSLGVGIVNTIFSPKKS